MNIIAVVGPSGSGKDTLLRYAAGAFAQRQDIVLARRYITRPPDHNEDNYFIDPVGFSHLRKSGFFLSTWEAHCNYYGIARHSIDGSNGYSTIICSISRSAILDFEKTCTTTTILVTARKDILRQRLLARSRESGKEIEQRLGLAAQKVRAKNLITFDNSGELDKSCAGFTALLKQLHGADC
jgi:phosphonate metabolism protein PhnN/1,5-bisphosphokinase (PRPP-forming)